MLGKGYLCAVVTQDAANWPTIRVKQAEDCPSERNRRSPSLDSMAKLHGQAAPANPSTDGSHQELWEQSQRNWQTFAHGTHNRGETPHRQVVRALVHGEKAQTQCLTVDQVFAEEIKGTNPKQESWATPIAQDSKHSGANPSKNGQRNLLVNQVNWATPQQRDFKDAEPISKWTERAEVQKAKGVNLHLPLPSQVMHTEEKSWATPQARDHKGSHAESFDNPDRSKNLNDQMEKIQTNGKLNPRWVETLMGLPVGWTMPSCKSPVTIEPTNYDCLETELSQQQQSEPLELF
jgi:hypothetical protein